MAARPGSRWRRRASMPQNHLHAWPDLAPEGAELAAVCDLDPGKAERAAGCSARGLHRLRGDARPGAARPRRYRDPRCTRTGRWRRSPAAKGVGMIVQKPLAPSWADCVAIAEAATAAGVFFAVHENFRFQTPMRRVRALHRQGHDRPAGFARIAFRTGFDVYRTQPYFLTEPRLAILDVGIHVLDLARVSSARWRGFPARPRRASRGSRGEDTRRCCSATTAARFRWWNAPMRRSGSRTASPRRCSRSRATPAAGHVAGLPPGGDQRRARLERGRGRAAPALDRAAVACLAGGRAGACRHFLAAFAPASAGNRRAGQSRDLCPGRGGLWAAASGRAVAPSGGAALAADR